MNYNEALEYIHAAGRFSKSTGLGRMRRLTELLGRPQDSLRFVHLAGTNGKGSTAAMLDSVLRAAGYKTGLFTSPYLTDFRERIRLNGENIPQAALTELTSKLRPVIERAESEGMEAPHEFELTALLALMYYARSGCQIVVWETGLGGRLDASNVIDAPLCAVITPLSLDHMQQLGSTLPLIAGEKCGIIKSGTPAVVSAAQPEDAMAVIRTACEKTGVALRAPEALERIGVTRDGCEFTWNGRALKLPLLGAHQVQNAGVALAVLKVLGENGLPVPITAVKTGLEQVRWAGRMEKVSADPLIVIDSAHNRGGIDALTGALDTLFSGVPITAVMGMMADKEYEYCISAVAARARRFVATTVGAPRSLGPENAAAVAKRHCGEIHCEDNLRSALELAKQLAEKDGLILVCGSVYAAGEARTIILG